jgi:hypothetical protein
MLAATFQSAGVKRVVTNNGRDFKALGVFEIEGFQS